MKKLKQRTSENTSVIYWLERSFPLAAHFNDIKHDIMSLRLFSIDPSPAPSREGDHNLLLNRSEASWIFSLRTLSPKQTALFLIVHIME